MARPFSGPPSPRANVRRISTFLAGALLALAGAGALLPSAFAADDPAPTAPAPTGPDPNAPATDAPDGSIWDYIEPGTPPASAAVESATVELAEERIEELGAVGGLGAAPPIEYYLDPIAATEKDPLHLDQVDPSEFDIPIATNDMVKSWMNYFLGRGRKYYARYLERSTRWLPMMHAELEARGMPRDLVYLSMIESGFSPGAYSYASAAGLWQFMQGTGRQYGLRIDWWVDERRDPEKATSAALDYLSYLNNMFDGDWFLSWASYNGGEGRVMNASKRYGTTDFWKIVAADTLHPETENYVPKLIAAAIIGKHPERYGFVGLKYQPAWSFDRVDVPASTSIDVLARCAHISEEDFLEYNPALRRWALPPDPEVQSIRIPTGSATRFKVEFAKVPPAERMSFTTHTVKRGESLGTIAKKYGVSVEELVRINRLQSASRVAVGTQLVVPVRGKGPSDVSGAPSDPRPADPAPKPTTDTTAKPTTPSSSPSTSRVTTYTVARGDTLASIAGRYGVSQSDLCAWNDIDDPDAIYAGQKLSVKSGGSSGATSSGSASSSGSSSGSSTTAAKTTTTSTTYKVRSGDTLSAIATKYGVSVSQIQSWNNLKGSTITVGQSLVVKGGSAPASSSSSSSAKTTVYTVRRGDSLGSIADRYDCTVSELKSWNGLSGSTIYPGQKLKIKE